MAFIFENLEIKRLWPEFNSSQKRFEQAYGLYVYEDQLGYQRLAIDKKKKYSNPLFAFHTLNEGYSLMRQLMTAFNLCPKLCLIQQSTEPCIGLKEHYCKG